MKRLGYLVALAVSLAACSDNRTPEVKTEKLEQDLERAGDKIEEKAAQAGDSIKEAYRDVKEELKEAKENLKARRDSVRMAD